MIKRITVRKGGLSATFLSHNEYQKEYGRMAMIYERERERIGFEENVYLRILNKEFGFYSLTQNNSNSQQGIDQDGATFLNNYYSTRQLLWQFEWFSSCAQKLDSVFYQSNQLLNIEIETENGVYLNSQATLTTRLEGGTVELECLNPYFKVQGDKVNDCFEFPVATGQISLINQLDEQGFKVNKVYFGDDIANKSRTIFVPVFADPTYTISGGWQNITIVNMTTGTTLTVNATCINECIIDTENSTIIIDGVDYTALAKGIYPTLGSGNNKLMFTFGTQLQDVEVCYEYDNLVGSVM